MQVVALRLGIVLKLCYLQAANAFSLQAYFFLLFHSTPADCRIIHISVPARLITL